MKKIDKNSKIAWRDSGYATGFPLFRNKTERVVARILFIHKEKGVFIKIQICPSGK